MIKEKFYKCRECEDITTRSEILDECGCGGAGMCYCQYDNDRILIPWKRISKKLYDDLKYKKNILKTGLKHSRSSLL